MRKQSWWRSNMDAWSFGSSKNDYVLNRSREGLQKKYQKHQPIKLYWPSYKPIVNDLTSNWEQANNQKPLTNQATEVKQLIQERLDCDKASNLSKNGRIATNRPDDWANNWRNTSTSTNTPIEIGVGQRSGSEVRGLKLVSSQEPTAEALKIQTVQKVDVRR